MLLALPVIAALACSSDDPQLPTLPPGLGEDAYGATGLRRLTRFEVNATVADVFGVTVDDLATTLPEDLTSSTPFDNQYEAQTVSPLVIGAYSAYAQGVAGKLVGVADLAPRLGGCTPAAADDAACFNAVAAKLGRRMFRRAITQGELDAYAAKMLPFARQTGSFSTAIEMLALFYLQHPEFLYRVEGEGTLDDFQVATRMAFLIWGRNPDDALLDAAQAGELADAGRRVAHAERMLADPQSRANWQRFHAQWLGFDAAPLPPTLAGDLKQETAKLVERVVFELDDDWLALFRWPETFVTPELATHYALGAVATPGWVPYPAGRGGGVLTHGTFLTMGAKFGDTSPTVRGYEIFKRLTCGSLGTIPADIDVDTPPGLPTDCKPLRYTMSTQTGCAGCHAITDGIGFGLENYGIAGNFREVEPDKPQCQITASGAWNGQPYTGPAELGRLISEDPRVSACATTQLFRFLTGRTETAGDANALAALDSLYRGERSLKTLILALVQTPAITIRKGI